MSAFVFIYKMQCFVITILAAAKSPTWKLSLYGITPLKSSNREMAYMKQVAIIYSTIFRILCHIFWHKCTEYIDMQFI